MPRAFERVSAFKESTLIDGDYEQPAQTHDTFKRMRRQTSDANLKTAPVNRSHGNLHRPMYNYKPIILRPVSLLALLLVTSGLIGLLEYAVIRLPHASTQLATRSIARRSDNVLSITLQQRQTSSKTTSIKSSSILQDTMESAYVQPSSTTTYAYTIDTSAYVGTKKTSTTVLASTTMSAYVSKITAVPSGSASPDSVAEHTKGTIVYRPWDAERTFQGTYLAVLVAVIYRMLWMTLYNGFNLVDPFLQLTQPNGATAGRAFFSFYQSQSNFLGPIPALANKRWILGIVATAYAVAGLLPAFASESIFVDTNWDCPNPNLKHKTNPCNPRVSVDVTVVRVLQGLLGFTAAVLIVISIHLSVKKTGLPTDPRSIATISALMQNRTLIDDLNAVPVHSTREEMQNHMRDKRYTFGLYHSDPQQQMYGIRPLAEGEWSQSATVIRYKYSRIETDSMTGTRTRFRINKSLAIDILLLLTTMAAFGVVLAYYLDGNSDGFNDFFNSNTFGPRFILTFAGTIIASMWKSVEQTATVMAPFTRLSREPSPPESTILFKASSTPLSSTWRSLRSGYILVAVITIITLLAEGLNLTISGVPYGSGQTWQQFLVSAYMSMAILGIMIITLAFVIVSRLREPRIPRRPDTLGSLMSYLSGSHMLDDFASSSVSDSRSRDMLLRQINRTFEFREALRADGKVAWKVDGATKHDIYDS